MPQEPPPRPSFAPRNWAGWLMVGVLVVLGHLPATLGRWLVTPLGPLLYHAMGRRRRIAERNIAACFPEFDAGDCAALVRASFASVARMLLEMAWCWAGGGRKVLRMGRIIGKEHLDRLVEEGHGVLVVTAHFTCLEIGGRLLCEHFSGGAIYRPLNNIVVEWYQTRGRLRFADVMISKRDIRSAVRYLRKGGHLWYAPDQDFGPNQCIFVPFFGIPTATLLATHRLPSLTGCRVIPMFPRYDAATRSYEVHIMPPIDDFPGEDPAADLGRINAILEAQVRHAPEQYWWIHRRFKTRPEGEPPFYA